MQLIKNERYTLQKDIEIVKINYKNGENFSETVCKIKSFPGRTVGQNPQKSIINRRSSLILTKRFPERFFGSLITNLMSKFPKTKWRMTLR